MSKSDDTVDKLDEAIAGLEKIRKEKDKKNKQEYERKPHVR